MDKMTEKNTNDNSSLPQFSRAVWKGPGWHGVATYAPWCAGAFFAFVGIAVLAEKRDIQYAPLIFFVAFLCILTMIPLKKLGKSVLTIGIDKKENLFWIRRKGLVASEPNADLIREFSFQKFVYTKVNPVWGVNPSQPLLFRNYKWFLTYKRSGNNNFWEFKDIFFATEEDAIMAARMANDLLGLHKKKLPN
jgi:hypothetical protein